MPILSDMVTKPLCVGEAEGVLLPVSPFYGPRYHFGMLLGLDDFETAQAYGRGKTWLHNAWLHREGVVWGFAVRRGDNPEEIEVDPGLALDAAGHELYLGVKQCINLGAWYDAHKADPDFPVDTSTPRRVSFHAHVVVRFRACLARPVPAMTQPCDGAGVETAYSRAAETVEILLQPNKAPDPAPLPYRRLRILFRLIEPTTTGPLAAADQLVVKEVARIQAFTDPETQRQAYLDAFRHFAALDEIDLRPAESPDDGGPLFFPADDNPPVVLADVTDIMLEQTDGGWSLASATIDQTTVRPSHVATATIQELLCGMLFATWAAGAAPAPPSPAPPDGHGPRIDRSTVGLPTNTRITLVANGPLDAASVAAAAFSVTTYNSTGGWRTIAINQATLASDSVTVTIDLREAVSDALVRIIAYGTGPTPLLGTNMIPLAGATDSPPGSVHDGNDFVYMMKRS